MCIRDRVRRRKHKKVLRAAKGFRGASGDVIKQAKQATMRAAAYSTRDRKVDVYKRQHFYY